MRAAQLATPSIPRDKIFAVVMAFDTIFDGTGFFGNVSPTCMTYHFRISLGSVSAFWQRLPGRMNLDKQEKC